MRKGFNHKAPCAVKRAGFVDSIMAGGGGYRWAKQPPALAGEYENDASH